MKKSKLKTNLELVQSIRRNWVINPKTRVQENKKLNKKKMRQEGKRQIKEESQ